MTIAGYLHIQRQNNEIETLDTRVGDLVTANKGWSARVAEQDRLRALEQKKNVLSTLGQARLDRTAEHRRCGAAQATGGHQCRGEGKSVTPYPCSPAPPARKAVR